MPPSGHDVELASLKSFSNLMRNNIIGHYTETVMADVRECIGTANHLDAHPLSD